MREPRDRTIRPECLKPFSNDWPVPTGDEVAELIRLSGFSCSQAAKAVRLKSNGARTVRKWVNNEANIPYEVWMMLCGFAGLCVPLVDANK